MDIPFSVKDTTDTSWKILIIDDDEEEFFIAKDMLKAAKGRKIDVHWASSYREGQQELLSDDYDAVLVDYDIGLHTGIDLIREVNKRGFASPLILFTGRGNYEVDVEAMQAGATLYLTKDEANSLLLERSIRYAIELKQKENTLRQISEALQESEQRHRVAIMNFPAVYAQTDRELRYRWIYNPHPDFRASDLLGKRDDELEDTEDTRHMVALKHQVLESGVGLREEVSFHRSDGIHTYDMTIEPIRDAEGQITGVATAALDITDRKRAELSLRESEAHLRESEAQLRERNEALEESEARWREFLESTHDNFIALDRDWHFTYVNRHYATLMGRDPHDLIGKNYWEMFPHYLGTELEQNYRKVMAEGISLHYQQRGIYTNYLYDVSIYPTREGLAVFSMNRTEEIRYQQQVENERARLEAVLQALPVGVWITDAEGRIVGKNEQADRIWAGDAPLSEGVEQYQEYQAWDVKSGKKLETEEYPLSIVLHTGQPVEPTEQRIQRFDGSEGYVLVTAMPIQDEEGRLKGVVAINLDITAQRQMQEENQRQKNLLERLVQTAPVGIAFLTGPRHVYNLVNDAYREGVGRTKGELVGYSVAEKWPEIADTVVPQLDQVYQTGEPFSIIDAPLTILRDGIPEQNYLTYTFTPIFQADGKIEGVMIMLIETTKAVHDRLALEAQTARLEAVLQALPLGVWFTDQNGQLLFKNEQVDRIWGGDAPLSESVEGYREYVAWFMDSGKLVAADEFPVAQALKTGLPGKPAELRIRRFDGTEGAVLALGAPIIDREGRMAGSVAINLDITERKQAELALRESEATLRESEAHLRQSEATLREREGLLRDVLESTHDRVLIVDRHWRLRYVNRRFAESMGATEDDFIGKNFWEVFDRYQGTLLEEHYRKVMEERVPAHFDIESPYTEAWFEISAYPTQDGISVFAHDRTEEKRTREALRESRERLERAQQIAHLGSWELDLIHNRLTWSDEVYRIFGLQPQEFGATYEAFLEHVHPEDRAAVDEAYSGSLRENRDRYEIEHRVVRAHTGEIRFVHERCEHFRDAAGQIIRSVGMVHDLTERKQAEQALRLSEERFYTAFNANPNAQVISRITDGRIESINAGFEQMFGYTRDEVIGKSSLELNMFADPTDRDEAVRRMRADQFLRDFELDILTKSGEIRQASLSVEMIEVGSELTMLTVLQDITARKQAEQALQAAYARLRFYVDANIVGVVLGKEDGTLIEVNDYYLNLLGYTREEFEAGLIDWRKITPPEHLHADEQAVTELKECGICAPYEKEYYRKDGSRVWVYLSNALLPDGTMAAFVLDISERKQVEKELLERDEVLQLALSAANAGVWSWDLTTNALQWSNQYYRIFGFEPGTIAPSTEAGFSRLHPDDRARVEATVQEAVAQGKQIDEVHRVIWPDGSVHWVRGLSQAFYDPQGKPYRMAGIALDVTRQKQEEETLEKYAEQLARSNQELEQFAFVASHDLQEPLRKIVVFSKSLRGLLSETPDQSAESQRLAMDFLNRMQNAAERMQTMINGLLELSRVSTRGAEFAPVNLNQLIQEVVSDLEIRTRAVQGQIEVEALPYIQGDAIQLRQLFQNLIGNALKFHKPGLSPIIRVSGAIRQKKQPPIVEIRVEDNGIGFEQQYAERIFQPFQRLHGRTEYEGTGLGLAICQKIVERHQGTIEVQSAPGEGSIFIIRLPLKPV